jgi:hypothetical protein
MWKGGMREEKVCVDVLVCRERESERVSVGGVDIAILLR